MTKRTEKNNTITKSRRRVAYRIKKKLQCIEKFLITASCHRYLLFPSSPSMKTSVYRFICFFSRWARVKKKVRFFRISLGTFIDRSCKNFWRKLKLIREIGATFKLLPIQRFPGTFWGLEIRQLFKPPKFEPRKTRH